MTWTDLLSQAEAVATRAAAFEHEAPADWPEYDREHVLGEAAGQICDGMAEAVLALYAEPITA
jgi:hypothetical protein